MKERLSNLISLGGFLCLLVVLATVPFIFIEATKEHPRQLVRTPCNLIGMNGISYDDKIIAEFNVNVDKGKCKRYGGWVTIWRYKGEITVAYSDRYDGGSRRDFAEINNDYSYSNFRGFERNQLFTFVGSWITALTLNYLLVGQVRLLPWQPIKPQYLEK